jgi:hypothetical protein
MKSEETKLFNDIMFCAFLYFIHWMLFCMFLFFAHMELLCHITRSALSRGHHAILKHILFRGFKYRSVHYITPPLKYDIFPPAPECQNLLVGTRCVNNLFPLLYLFSLFKH